MNVHSFNDYGQKLENKTRYPSTREWINKLWHILTTEYYLAIKRNELSSNKKKNKF